MSSAVSLVLLCLTVTLTVCEEKQTMDFETRQNWVDRWLGVMDEVQQDPKLMELYLKENKDDDFDLPDWTCPQINHEPATNVRELSPYDVNVVAAFGDSLTAGNGLGSRTALHILAENRGESFSIGTEGLLEGGILTMPNIIKMYNPDLKGGAVCGEPRYHPLARLNRAQPGGTNRHMIAQAEEMIDLMTRLDEIDIENDWKVITMFIGGNDLCGYCRYGIGDPENQYGPEKYIENVEGALDILLEHSPRTFVNLVPMFDVTPLTNLSSGPLCDILHRAFCDCAVNETTRQVLRDVQLGYYYAMVNLTETRKYEKDDFTVVVQQHLVDMEALTDEDGNWDNSMFAQDCFHLNRQGHYGMAYMLWNTMLTPVGQKPRVYDYDQEEGYYCVSEEFPYLFSADNSDVGDWSPQLNRATTRGSRVKKP